MKDFFNDLTPEKILNAAETAGGRATGRIYQLNSLENRVYEIEMESGDPVVGKFYRAGRWSFECILEEHEFLKDLIAAETPVVAPLSLNGSISETLGATPDGLFYSIFPKARGRAPSELTTDQAKQLGRLVARMHAVGETKVAKHRLQMSIENFALKPLDFLLSGHWIAIECEARYKKVVEDIVNIVSPMLKNIPVHRIHGDCHLGNLLFDGGGTKAFFLDFDDMMVGPAVQDIWLATPDSEGEENTTRLQFLEGYDEMRAFDRKTLRLIEPLRALRIIHYSAWIAKRWEDPHFQKTFTEFRDYRYWAFELENLERVLRKLQSLN